MARKRDVVKVLRKARALVAAGWIQNEEQNVNYDYDEETGEETETYSYCMIGATREVNTDAETDAELALCRIINKRFDKDLKAQIEDDKKEIQWGFSEEVTRSNFIEETITGWNDEAERTQKQVLKVFDKAIASLS